MSGVDLSSQAAMLSKGIGYGNTGWFGPGPILPPMAPENFGWGRTLDYSQATNATITPKAVDGGLTYRQLRSLAESSDYVSIAIQTVLDRLCATKGRVVDVGGDPRKPSKRAEEINAWAQAMDGITPLPDFLQAAAYDMCVIDAATAYVDKTNPSKPIAYNVDGATIVAHLDERGRVASLGQVVKGQIAHEYTRDQMIWMPKNRRPNAVYGCSFVQQVQNIVAIALKRTARQMDWFTQGNVPDVLFVAPDGWTPQQVKDINANWEKQLAGISGKSRGRWVPPGTTVESLDRNPVAGEFDEWLIRVICYAFSLPPTAFVQQVNRSTSETMQDASVTEGHAAILRWAESFLTAIISSAWGPGFRWMWDLEQPSKEDVIKLVLGGALKTSALLRLGVAPEEIAEPPKLAAMAQQEPEKKAKDDAAKDGKPIKNGMVENADLPAPDSDLAAIIQKYLDSLKEAAQDVGASIFSGEAAELSAKAPKSFVSTVTASLEQAGVDGAIAISSKIASDVLPDAIAGQSLQYARDRAAEMVGMRWDGSKLVENPNVKWQISDMARQSIRDAVSDAFENGGSLDSLRAVIGESKAFSPARALNIARTEIATAQQAGALEYLRKAGISGKRWSDFDGCPICKRNAAQGVIPLEKAFQSGHMHAPSHPGCRCTIIPEEIAE